MNAITRREFVKGLAAGAAVAATSAMFPRSLLAAEEPAAGRKPNILLIYIDDLGWKDVAFMGSKYYETPNIDRLASQGVVFMQAYSNGPSCAPSRACLMSGQYGPRHGVYKVGKADVGPKNKQKLIPTPNTETLRPDIVSMAEALKAAGYITAHMGKWHLGNDPELGPHSQGFDINLGGTSAGQPKSYFSPYRNPTFSDGPEGEYLTDRLTDEAARFLEANKDKPFFLYLPHFAVHVPLQAKKDMMAKYEKKAPDGEQKNATYAAMIESTDQGVGRLMQKLDDLKIADRTIVIFYSDNGGQLGITEQKPLRAGKGYLYEGGIRVPMIVRWPGITKAGRTCQTPVMGIDLYPTFLEAAGAKAPENQILDGESLVPVLRGNTEKMNRRYMFWHFPCYQPGRGEYRITPSSVIREGDWKLTEHFEDGRLELYNLADDISEKNDLAANEAERVKSMKAALDAWHKAVGAKIPTAKNPKYDPDAPYTN